MDIPLPEQGLRFSFKKLGGNPTMTLSYRKKGIISKLIYPLLLLTVVVGTLKLDKWGLPVQKIAGIFERKNLGNYYHAFLRSRLVKIIPTLMMISAYFVGLPLFVMGMGLNTILLLRYLSLKRYAKKAFVPRYDYRIFMKYFLSYVILGSSFLFVVIVFHPIFLVPLSAATFLNGILVAGYAVFLFFTKREITEEVEENRV